MTSSSAPTAVQMTMPAVGIPSTRNFSRDERSLDTGSGASKMALVTAHHDAVT
jgi:hypothetical protein